MAFLPRSGVPYYATAIPTRGREIRRDFELDAGVVKDRPEWPS